MAKSKTTKKPPAEENIRDAIQNCITSPKDDPDDKDKPKLGDVNHVRYNQYGLAKDISEKEACALQIRAGLRTIYKVKCQRGGHFYNPLKESFSYSLNKIDRSTGDAMFKFREVSKAAFEKYISFLKTRQDSFLVSSEREV